MSVHALCRSRLWADLEEKPTTIEVEAVTPLSGVIITPPWKWVKGPRRPRHYRKSRIQEVARAGYLTGLWIEDRGFGQPQESGETRGEGWDRAREKEAKARSCRCVVGYHRVVSCASRAFAANPAAPKRSGLGWIAKILYRKMAIPSIRYILHPTKESGFAVGSSDGRSRERPAAVLAGETKDAAN